ncbi:c-type cytochrome [Stenotrophomonas sp. PD6]|uniref:c-type cytochrome n=1 Tax=Stenotrophomonas sp. PD6 TaxID=3368612 RepID=UPI003BA3DF01
MRPQPLAACLALAVLLPLGAAAQAATAPAVPATAPAVPAPAAPAPAVPAAAPAAAPAALVGNADNGRTLAYTCQGCHGITGYKNAYPSYRVPKIGGQTQQYLSQALSEYRQGKRRHPTMQAQSMSFSEQEIADLAVYLSTVK